MEKLRFVISIIIWILCTYGVSFKHWGILTGTSLGRKKDDFLERSFAMRYLAFWIVLRDLQRQEVNTSRLLIAGSPYDPALVIRFEHRDEVCMPPTAAKKPTDSSFFWLLNDRKR